MLQLSTTVQFRVEIIQDSTIIIGVWVRVENKNYKNWIWNHLSYIDFWGIIWNFYDYFNRYLQLLGLSLVQFWVDKLCNPIASEAIIRI